MEKTITMSISEYEELVHNTKLLTELSKKSDSILLERSYLHNGMFGNLYNWNIYTKDETIKNLVEHLISVHEKNNNLQQEIHKLKNAAALKKPSKYF